MNLLTTKTTSQVKLVKYFNKLDGMNRYKIKDTADEWCWGELRRGLDNSWNWFFRGEIKVLGKGQGSFEECVNEIKNFFGKEMVFI